MTHGDRSEEVGAASEAEKRLLTYGACAGLAIAVHRLTGWPLIKITDAHAVYPDPASPDLSDQPAHARAATSNVVGMGAGGLHWMVLTPEGDLLDIDGRRDPLDVLDDYDDEADDGVAALGQVPLDDALDEYVTAKGEPLPLSRCEQIARHLLSG